MGAVMQDLRKEIDRHNKFFVDNKGKANLNLSKSIAQIRQNIELAEEAKYYGGTIEAYQILGVYYCYAGDSNNAYINIKKAEDLYNNYEQDSRQLIRIYNAYVIYYADVKKEYTNAIEYCNKGLKLARKYKDSEMIRRLTHNIGILFYQLGLYENSLKSLYEALHYAILSNSSRGEAYAYSNLANCYFLMKNKSKAREYYIKTIELSNEIDEIITFANASSGLAKLAYEEKNTEIAIEYLVTALDMLKKNDQKNWELNVSLDLLEIYIEQEYVDKIAHILPRMNQIAKELDNNFYSTRLYKASASYYALIGNYKSAFRKSQKSIQYQGLLDKSKEFDKVREVKSTILYQQYKQLEIISEIGKQITSINDLQKIFQSTNELLAKLYDDFNFAIGIYDGESVNYDHFNMKGKLIDPFSVSIDNRNSFGNYVIKNDKSILISDIYEEYDEYIEEFQLYGTEQIASGEIAPSLMLAPLKIQDEILGVLHIQSYQKFAFSVDDIKILEIVASYVSIAINNFLQRKKLKELAIRDALTGLYNWRYFKDNLHESIRTCQTDNSSLSLVIIDIDHFKKVNDQYGHEAGNVCLQELSKILKEVYNSGEKICRIGGEEFAIISIENKLEKIIEKSNSIVRIVADSSFKVNENEIKVTISAGHVSFKDKPPTTTDNIFRQADNALYEAKNQGRNQVVVKII